MVGEAEQAVEAAVSRATAAIEHALLETTKGFYEHTIYDDKVRCVYVCGCVNMWVSGCVCG